MDKPETTSKVEEPQITPVEQTPAPEEPIILKELFPNAEKDLDVLFPEPSMKKLLKDVVKTKQKNDRFLNRINLRKILSESEEDEWIISKIPVNSPVLKRSLFCDGNNSPISVIVNQYFPQNV